MLKAILVTSKSHVAGLSLLALAVSGACFAQAYPNKPVRMMHGFVAGSSTDLAARIVATEMTKRLPQPVVIESRPGANGSIAADQVIRSTPDGYNLYFGSVMNFHPIFVKNAAVDAGKQLAPVSNSMSGLWNIFVSNRLKVNSVQELVALSKANPDKLNFASIAAGADMLVAILKANTGLTYTNIAYGGSAAKAGVALTNGEADFAFQSMATIGPFLQSVKGLMIGGPARLPQLPDVPTAREVGLPNFENSAFNFGVWAPIGMPRDIVDKLSSSAASGVKSPEGTEQVRKINLIVVGSTPEEQLRTFNAEAAFWAEGARLTRFEPQ